MSEKGKTEYPHIGHPLQRLGAFLTDRLDDLEFLTAERLLLDAYNHDCDRANPRPAGELVEQLGEFLEFWPSGPSENEKKSWNVRAEELLHDCFQALQGVRISRECAETSLQTIKEAPFSVMQEGIGFRHSDKQEAAKAELEQALERSNGR